MIEQRVIGIDWGTTNRRCYLIEGGRIAAARRDGLGTLSMTADGWSNEIASIRSDWGEAPVLIAGMAGSNRGWREVPYVDCPATPEALCAGIDWIAPEQVGIVPGVAQRDGDPDVMRGEEVQFLGAVAAGLVPADALLCQPGTHCKWAWMRGGAIARFESAMTGEIFALLRDHSLLAGQLSGQAADGAAFREGVADAQRRSLTSALFGIRAASLLGMRPDEDATSYASGLLIGADVAARVSAGVTIYILADPALGALYASAVRQLGGSATMIDSESAFVAGISSLWDRII